MTIYTIATPDLAVGGCLQLHINGRAILLSRSADGFHASATVCPHQGKSLEGARIRQGFLMCPHHGARFSLLDGKSLSPLTTNALPLYRVSQEDGMLTIDTGDR